MEYLFFFYHKMLFETFLLFFKTAKLYGLCLFIVSQPDFDPAFMRKKHIIE